MSTLGVTTIDSSECIGASLTKINANFDNLRKEIVTIKTTPLDGNKVIPSFGDQDVLTTGRLLIGAGSIFRGGLYLNNKITSYAGPADTQDTPLNQLDKYPGDTEVYTKTIAATIRTTGPDAGGLLIIVGDNNGDESALDIWNGNNGGVSLPTSQQPSGYVTPGLKYRIQSDGKTYIGSDFRTDGRISVGAGDTFKGGLYILDKQVRFTDNNKLGTYPPAGESNGFNAVIQGNGIDDGGMLIIVGDNNQDEKAIDVWNIGLPSSGSSTNSVGGPSRKFMVQSGGQVYAASSINTDSNITARNNIIADKQVYAKTNIRTDGDISIGAGDSFRGGLFLSNRTVTYRGPSTTQPGPQITLDGYPGTSQPAKTIAATIRTTGSDAGGLLIVVGDDNGDESGLDIWNGSTALRGLKFRCTSNGNVSCRNLTETSDRNKKTEIEDTKINGIDFINRFRVVDYLWKDTAETDKNKNIGLIAQEVEEHYPSSTAIEGGTYNLRYSSFVGPLIKATQELSQLVKEQQKIIEELTQRVNKLESK